MKIAAHGFISDSGVSSAGSFPALFRALLGAGHRVDFFGIPAMTHPKTLDALEGYRYLPLRVEWSKRYGRRIWALENQYASAVYSVAAHIAYQREAVRRIEAMPDAYDFVLCLDTPNLFRSRLPVVSWPQGPPHTEWAALRTPELRARVIQAQGALYYGAVQSFYAYRWLQARLALTSSDVMTVSSQWAVERWQDFGLSPDRLRLVPYPVALDALASVPTPDAKSGAVTFLWLGRSVPRKRLDLFLAAFDLVRRDHPASRAVLVGHLREDRSLGTMLERYTGDPNVEIRPPLDHTRVPELFAETHVLVQPSQNENFGFSLAEALAAGRPVVAGPTNGTAAFAGDALFGFERYDASGVAEAMLRARAAVLADPAGVASAARAAARRHFAVKDTAERLVEVARAAIARRSAVGPGAAR